MNIIEQYYTSFNAGNYQGMLDLLDDNVLHEPSQGSPRLGKAAFTEFLAHMERCYKEEVIAPRILISAGDAFASAEFMLRGTYLQTDSDLPQARGQTYHLRVGAFFDISNGKISRVSNHYNLSDWMRQVSM
jgi:steroid delta-isomerase-like uncharacterized protein